MYANKLTRDLLTVGW